MRRVGMSCARRRFVAQLGGAAITAIVSPHALAQAQAQAQANSWRDEAWRDPARSRDLPLRLRLPAGADSGADASGAAASWPVVLHSHGLGGSREGGDVWGRAWQDAGMLVVHLQHPGSDIDTLRQGLPALRAAASAEQLLARVADVRFVLDEITRRQAQGVAPWSGARVSAVGLAGHSFGAQTTQAVAGQRFPVPVSARDPRIAAFIALSPNPARSSQTLTTQSLVQQFGAVDRPFMVVTGSRDGDPLGRTSDVAEAAAARASVFEGLPAGQRGLLWLAGADHMTFAGNAAQRIAGRGPFQRDTVAQQRESSHHALTARITRLWWQAHLSADPAVIAAARHALRSADGLANGLADGDRLQID